MKDKIEPVPGYDWHNYNQKQGINPDGADVVSNQVIEQVAELILGGYADVSIRDILYRTYGLNSYCAKFITAKAHRFINSSEERQTENMLAKQNSRLFKLYRDCVDKGDNKTALAILSEINKLNKLYITKVEVSSDVLTLDLGIETKTDDSTE